MPSPTSQNSEVAVNPGNTSPLSSNVMNANDPSSLSESELSEAKDVPPVQDLTSESESRMEQEENGANGMDISESSAEDDAEGSDDADFEMEIDTGVAAPQDGIHDRSTSSSADSQRPSKRKHSTEADHYVQMNPELYGLRRSGRARPSRTIIDTSDDDDSDAAPSRKRQKRSVTTKASRTATPAALSSDSDSDSDVYVGGRRQILSKKQRRHQQQVAAGLAPPTQAEVRFSSRAAKKTNYAEDDGDSFEEEDSDALTPSYWAVEQTGPAIDEVLNHRLPEGSSGHAEEPKKQDYEYLVKWQGQAHYHSSWNDFQELSSLRGIRKVENYFRKIVLAQIYISQDEEVPIEEREKWCLDREQVLDALEECKQVERVIGKQRGEDETEYFVKWKTLTYDYCTWEPVSLVSELAQKEIDRYLDRSSMLPESKKSESNPATRGPPKKIEQQPSYIKHGDLREFQIQGINFLAYNWCKGNNVILADEMGLGKTVQTVSFMNWLRHARGQQGPFIVVVPLSTMPAWADTFNNWTPDINYVVYNGNEASRKIIREHEMLVDGNPRKVKFHVLLTTYEYILADSTFLSQIKWQFMAVDEAHRLKNRESQLYNKLMGFGAPSRLLITGTPMQNTLGELSALMDFLMPGQIDVEENIDLASAEASQKLAELTNAISPYMIRRTKQKVENDLPPKTEKIIRVELSDVQLEYYKNILTRNYAALNQGAKGQKQSLLNIMMELKKASNHPFMFPNAEDKLLAGSERREDVLRSLVTSSGKMMLLDRLLTKLKQDNHRVLIFSQMVKMLDILGDYLQLRGYQFQRLDGTIAAGPRRQAIDHFNAPGSQDFCFLLSTRAGGLGINLMTADTVIIFDSDWNPQADLQAMARAHRIGQKNPVTIYRLVSKDTVEEEVLERARNKLMLEFITIQRGVTDKDAKDLSDRMVRAGAIVSEPTSSDDISRILKKRGQKMFEQTGNQKKLEELDIDAVLENAEEHRTEQPEGITADGGEEFLKSFEYTDVKIDIEWDDIIPKEQLESLKEAEKKEHEEQYLQSVIEQNAPRKRKSGAHEEREQRAAKKRARDLAAEAAADIDSDNSGPDLDPKRPLNEKETRNLIRAYEKFGSLELRGDEMVREAKLVGRDSDVVKDTLDDIVATCHRLLKEQQAREEALAQKENKVLTKKDRKAVLFDYNGVKRINAETIIQRPIEMQMLKDVVASTSEWRNFRVPEASKAAHYTAEWGAREDGMLCVGISRHGYGSWVAIRDDPELGMTDKFFLEEHRVDKKEERQKAEDAGANAKSPGAVHLVRRANYLLSVLRDKTSDGTDIAARRAIENHHRNAKKGALNRRAERGLGVSTSASPAPSSMKKAQRESDKYRHRANSSVDRRVSSIDRNGTPDHRRTSSNHVDRHRHGRLDERPRHPPTSKDKDKRPQTGPTPSNGHPTERLTRIFAPIQSDLEAIRKTGPDERARLDNLKMCLLKIGQHIRVEAQENESVAENSLWQYVADHHWPKKGVPGKNLAHMFGKLSREENSKGDNKPKPTNGHASKVMSNGTSNAKATKPAVRA
ncbi:hypothetical protein K402DRAFT_405743 [Aulographum hederae CBS 113979]|uniref:Uncharacterized protein n=1 Tax=Aulographum hederae CBS 113979 TaxID=1176131 RepID=A0A6G1GV59_9PEZI|nr:hypothetical protein K402DRAFT_405743 [Aulographum hederae CBS 113979]